MQTVTPTTTITVDGSTFDVAQMSAEVQQMVTYFDDWRQQEAVATSKLLMVRSALRDIQNTLLETIQKERSEALKKAQALGIIPPAADTDTQTPTPKEPENEAY